MIIKDGGISLKRYFRTIQSVLDSRWGNFQYAGTPAAQKTDRVLQSSKLEDCIYRDLSRDDENLKSIQQKAVPKLHSFPALSRDVFQSFYSLFPKRNAPDRLTAEAQKFNAKLLDHVTEDADYPTIKSICEGRELPAYEAASEFTAKIGAQLDDLLPELEELALDVIERWLDEKDGETEVGRVLPREYLFFTGDGKHNHFRTEWDGGQVWDWSLQSPYEE